MKDWQAVVSAGLNQRRQGDAKSAKKYLEQALEDRSAPAGAWLLLSNIRASLGDAAGREQALDEALQRDGNNIAALLTKGELVAARGDDRAACSFLGLALANAPSDASIELQQRLARAEQIMARAQQRFGEHLEQRLQQAGLADQRPSRFQEALQIIMGERSIQLQQPTSFFYPGLPQSTFHDPSDFPWIAELEKRTEAMRGEVEALLAEDGTFTPYLQSDPTRANRGHPLLNDNRWSAFYLWKDGAPVAGNAARCPETMRAL